MFRSLIGLGCAAAVAGSAVLALAGGADAVAAQATSPKKNTVACFSNLGGDTGYAVPSQHFESSWSRYDSVAADNFALTADCSVDHLRVHGQYFRGSGPTRSETVTFYADDADGVPGTVIAKQRVTSFDNGTGSLRIPIDSVSLRKGTYWISVVANMDFSSGGQWGWEVTSTKKGTPVAQWQNPKDGFGSGCTTWGSIKKCAGAEGPDLMFGVFRAKARH